MTNYLNEEIRGQIEKQVEEFFRYLNFTETVTAINYRYPHYEQVGFAVNHLITKAIEKK